MSIQKTGGISHPICLFLLVPCVRVISIGIVNGAVELLPSMLRIATFLNEEGSFLGSLAEGRFPHSVEEMSAKQTKGDGRVALAKSLILTEGVKRAALSHPFS